MELSPGNPPRARAGLQSVPGNADIYARSKTSTARGLGMDAFVQLQVPPAAETARLLTRHHRWGLYYRSLVGDTEGRLEFRQIDSEMLRADDVDPDDAEAVIDHIERRLYEAGYDTTRQGPDDGPVAATWDLRPRATR